MLRCAAPFNNPVLFFLQISCGSAAQQVLLPINILKLIRVLQRQLDSLHKSGGAYFGDVDKCMLPVKKQLIYFFVKGVVV
jgi:hypothetical protein